MLLMTAELLGFMYMQNMVNIFINTIAPNTVTLVHLKLLPSGMRRHEFPLPTSQMASSTHASW